MIIKRFKKYPRWADTSYELLKEHAQFITSVTEGAHFMVHGTSFKNKEGKSFFMLTQKLHSMQAARYVKRSAIICF